MYLLEPANKDCEHAEASVLTQELSKARDVGLHQLDTTSVLSRAQEGRWEGRLFERQGLLFPHLLIQRPYLEYTAKREFSGVKTSHWHSHIYNVCCVCQKKTVSVGGRKKRGDMFSLWGFLWSVRACECKEWMVPVQLIYLVFTDVSIKNKLHKVKCTLHNINAAYFKCEVQSLKSLFRS